MTTELTDCAAVWAALPADTRNAIGTAAVLWLIASAGAADAAEAHEERRQRFYDIAEGVATDALTEHVDALPAESLRALPDLGPFRLAQCPECGSIEELRCPSTARGCPWAAAPAAAAE